MEHEHDKQFEREANAFHALLDFVQDVPNVSRGERHALAFIVDDQYGKEPDSFEQFMEQFKSELLQIKTTEGVPGLTWRLAQEFHRRYDAFLVEQGGQEQDPVRRENLRILHERLARDMEVRQRAYAEGRHVPIGSVILEHVPPWFRQVS